MISRRKKILALGAVAIGTATAAFAAVVFGGAVTVAATDPHYPPVQWVLETTMESSIRAHAADIEVPAGVDLRDPELAEHAFGHYSVACTPCHGAPGVDPAPWLVLNPPAGSLVDTAAGWSDAELYWIVKNGIKMTGMPALGPTHGDEDLWAISAFVRQLPEMTAEEYGEMAARYAARHVQTMAPKTAPAVTTPAPPPKSATAPKVTEEAASTHAGTRQTPNRRTPAHRPIRSPRASDPEAMPESVPAPHPPKHGHKAEPNHGHHHH